MKVTYDKLLSTSTCTATPRLYSQAEETGGECSFEADQRDAAAVARALNIPLVEAGPEHATASCMRMLAQWSTRAHFRRLLLHPPWPPIPTSLLYPPWPPRFILPAVLSLTPL
jgi:hypothetical protein